MAVTSARPVARDMESGRGLTDRSFRIRLFADRAGPPCRVPAGTVPDAFLAPQLAGGLSREYRHAFA
jgi:hypothetical protein